MQIWAPLQNWAGAAGPHHPAHTTFAGPGFTAECVLGLEILCSHLATQNMQVTANDLCSLLKTLFCFLATCTLCLQEWCKSPCSANSCESMLDDDCCFGTECAMLSLTKDGLKINTLSFCPLKWKLNSLPLMMGRDACKGLKLGQLNCLEVQG